MNNKIIHLVFVLLLTLGLYPLKSSAQSFSISLAPENAQYQPVLSGDSWHAINSGTTYNASYFLPENGTSDPVRTNLTDSTYYTTVVKKEYSFIGFRVNSATTNYTAATLQNYIGSTSSSTLTISAVCKETSTSIRTNYKNDKVDGTSISGDPTETDITSNKIDLKLYTVPMFSTTVDDAEETLWSTTSPKVYSCTSEGGNNWSYDFYYTINGSGRVNAANQSLSVPLTSTKESNKIVVAVENVKCLAPDGLTDWTPSEAKKNLHHSFTVWALPSVVREAGIDAETYIFAGRTLTLAPIVAGGDKNAWSYKWEVANGTCYTSTVNVSTNNGSLRVSDSSRTLNTIKLTASNKPSGLADTTFVLTYDVYTIPEPTVTFIEHDFIGFDGEKLSVDLNIKDISNNAYYPNESGQQSKPECYYIQNGVKHTLTATGSSNYSGTYSYSGSITPSRTNGKESIQLYWGRQLRHTNANYKEDCQLYTYTKDFELNICRKPDVNDISLAGSDEYAIAKEGHIIELHAQAGTMPMPGVWSYRWSMNNAKSSDLNYSVTASDVQPISGNTTYQRTYTLDATYILNNEKSSQQTISVPFTITYCAVPNVSQVQTNISTCVGRSTQLGINYTGGYLDGWSTVWYDSDGHVLSGFDSHGGSVSFNTDIDTESEVKHYKAELVNEYRGRQWFRMPIDYTITLYHRPEVSIDKLGMNETEGVVNVYGGDSDKVNVLTLGGYPGQWHFDWKKNGMTAESGSSLNITTANKEAGDSKTTNVYTVRVYNYENNPQDLWFDKTYKITYDIWSKGKLDLMSRNAKTDLYGDGTPCNGKVWNEATLSMGTKGGYSDGWTFNWEVLSNPYAVIAHSPVSEEAGVGQTVLHAKNQTEQIQTVKLLLTAQNSIEGKNGNADTAIFVVNVYPKATLSWDFETEQEINMYYGGRQDLSVNSHGGNSSSWHLNWRSESNKYSESRVIGGDGKTSSSFCSMTRVAPDTENDFLQKDMLIADNYSPNGQELWFSQRLYHKVHRWSKGAFNGSGEHDQYCLGGDDEDDPSGGFAIFEDEMLGGCHAENTGIRHTEYTWKIFDGTDYVDIPSSLYVLRNLGLSKFTDNSTDNKLSISVKGYNVGLSPKDVYLYMTWQNKVDDWHVGNNGSAYYHVIVYPGIIKPKQNSTWSNDVQISRDVDGKIISLESGLGGGRWEYLWYDNGSLISQGNQTELNLDFSDGSQFMSVKEHDISVEWTNYRPDGTVWKQGVYHQPIKVYNTPMTPLKLQPKGNGRSHIYVADMQNLNISEESIFTDPYSYSLFFGQGNDISGASEETQLWHQYSAEPSSPWVRSCWHYADGYDCYSDIVDVYGNTRGVSSIEDIEEERTDEFVRILSLNGALIRKANTMDIGQLGLASGIYVVKNMATGLSKKVVIK